MASEDRLQFLPLLDVFVGALDLNSYVIELY